MCVKMSKTEATILSGSAERILELSGLIDTINWSTSGMSPSRFSKIFLDLQSGGKANASIKEMIIYRKLIKLAGYAMLGDNQR